jgi:hypothetical protein
VPRHADFLLYYEVVLPYLLTDFAVYLPKLIYVIISFLIYLKICRICCLSRILKRSSAYKHCRPSMLVLSGIHGTLWRISTQTDLRNYLFSYTPETVAYPGLFISVGGLRQKFFFGGGGSTNSV